MAFEKSRIIRAKGVVYARPETCYWDAEVLERFGIAEAFCLYVVPYEGIGRTVDTINYAQHNVFMHWLETPESVQHAAEEELGNEGTSEMATLFWSEIEKADPRLIRRLSVSEKVTGEVHPEHRTDMLMAAYCAAPEEPAILDYATWAAWRAEKQEKRRARNLPPIANWGANGLDNLPIFTHAARQIMEPRQPLIQRIADRYGSCIAHRAAKRPLERLNWSWAL